MKSFLKENNQQKHQFRSYYCLECKQTKPCGVLGWERCCTCSFQAEQERAKEYSSYQLVYQQKLTKKKAGYKQLELLKGYQGCSECGSKEVDAYSLYSENRLVCQFCLMRKVGGSSHPISFSEQQKWYKKRWGINLTEWVENYGYLPVNANCAREWLRDKGHLSVCRCLELEVKELVELFTGSLQESQEKLTKCKCVKSEKFRVDYIGSEGKGWTECQLCQKSIESAGHHGVIKNRNDPKFWGLEVREKVLCGDCLESKKEEMKPLRRAEFNRYRKLGRL